MYVIDERTMDTPIGLELTEILNFGRTLQNLISVDKPVQCIWVKAVNLVASYRRGICLSWGAFLEWRTAQKIGRCLESAVKSPCNFSGSVLPSGFLIACLIPTVRLYVVCWRQICILLLLIVLADLLKSRMCSMDCKVVQCSNRKCWEPHRFPCKSSFAFQTIEGMEGS